MAIGNFLRPPQISHAILKCVVCGLVAFFPQAHGASTVSVPEEGKALIVFVRPEPNESFLIYRRGVLFEVKDEPTNPEVVGIIGSNTRVMHQTTPGKHLFMIWGEIVDFMTADVVAGMTYYVTLLTHPGNRSQYYTFRIVDREQQASKEFKELIAGSKVVDDKAESIKWATLNMPTVRQAQSRDYPTWAAKPESQRSSLLPIHGVAERSQMSVGAPAAPAAPAAAAAAGAAGAAADSAAPASAVIKGQPTVQIKGQPTVQTTEEKLKELKRLNDAGLISREVYLEQQRAILSKP